MSLRTRARALVGRAPWLGPAVGAGSAVVAAVALAIGGHWAAVMWALIAAAWALLPITHRCAPASAAPADHGVVCVHFVGGPQDGGSILMPARFGSRDLIGVTLTVEDDDYEIHAVEQTCFRAELPGAPGAAR